MLPPPPLTNDDTAFLNALAANPADEAVWLIYSDWLAENDAPRGDYLRALLDVLTPTTRSHVEELRQRLAMLAPTVELEWRSHVMTLWATAPMVAMVTDLIRMGNIPPQEMFDRAMSMPILTLLRGTARIGMWVHIPRAEGEPLHERLPNIETFAQFHETMVFTDALPPFAVGFSGHRLAEAGILIGGLMREAPAP